MGISAHKISKLVAGIVLVMAPFSALANVCATAFADSPFVSETIRYEDNFINPKLLHGPAGERLRYTHVRLAEGERPTEAELFREPSDFIIGIDTTGNTKGHMYVAMNDVRFDGRMFFAPGTFERPGWTVRPGLLIRYKNVPPETRQRLWDWMNSGETIQAPTCVFATCKLFFQEMDFQRPGRRYWFPDKMIRHLVEKAPLERGGEALPFEIYAINKDFKTFWSELPSWRTVPQFFFKVLFDPKTWGRAPKEPK